MRQVARELPRRGADGGLATGERALRQLSRLLLAGLLSTLLIVCFLLLASVQAVHSIDRLAAARELDQVERAIAAAPAGIDAITLDAISHALDLDHARLTTQAGLRPGEISVPVAPGADRLVAWRPHLFGSITFATIGPLRLVAGLVFVGIVGLIGWRVVQVGRLLDSRRAEAARMAATDPLTGLANRLAFDAELRARCAAAAQGGPGFVLLTLDLDGFKAINDELGHGAGDAVLRAVGAHLQAAADAGDMVARIGGDEFAVLRPASGLDEYLGDLRLRLAAPVGIEGRLLRVGASVGVARSEDFPGAAGRLSHAADMALYRAKRSGAGRAELAVPTAADRRAA